MICSHCGAEGAFPKGSFGAVCEGCGRYLHSCSQCRLYVVSTRRCISSTSEQPADPVHRNFCEEFEPLNARRDGGEAAGSDEARSKFLDLFGGKG
jgi:hypothetical protein